MLLDRDGQGIILITKVVAIEQYEGLGHWRPHRGNDTYRLFAAIFSPPSLAFGQFQNEHTGCEDSNRVQTIREL